MSDTGDGGEGFLGRWSRLKRQPAPVETPERPGQDMPAGVTPGEDSNEPASVSPSVATGPGLPDLPELPSLESITAATDMRVFMHPAVPDSIRNAALRKLWTVDPAIRDFVSPALDYAYDWNTPGGAPGYGPLGVGDDVARMLSEAVNGFTRPAAQDPGDGSSDPSAPAQGQQPDGMPAAPDAIEAPEPTSMAAAGDPSPPPEAVRVTLHAPEVTADDRSAVRPAPLAGPEPRAEVLPAGARRRHGGALPS